MRLLRRQNVIKVVTPKGVEDLIKDLLEAPEELGKNIFTTKLIISFSGIDGVELRNNIFNWLLETFNDGKVREPITKEDLKVIEVTDKSPLEKAFDTLIPKKDSDGETA